MRAPQKMLPSENKYAFISYLILLVSFVSPSVGQTDALLVSVLCHQRVIIRAGVKGHGQLCFCACLVT